MPGWRPGVYRLAQALLTWDDLAVSQDSISRSGRAIQRQDILIQVNPISEMTAQAVPSPNQRVIKLVEKVEAFALCSQALNDATRGDLQAATLRLRQAATRLLDMDEALLTGEMLRQAEALEQGRQLDSNATKILRYQARNLTYSLRVEHPQELTNAKQLPKV